jgi:hypothetical protein
LSTTTKQLPRRLARCSGHPADPLEELLFVAAGLAEADEDVAQWLDAMLHHDDDRPRRKKTRAVDNYRDTPKPA